MGSRKFLLVAVLAACVADDDDEDSGAADSTSGATANADDGEPQSCTVAQQAAVDFIANNSACMVDEDCTQVLGQCVPSNVCGAVALAVTHDAAAWAMIDAALQTCTECGGDPCGGCTTCDDGVCSISLACD